MNYTTNYGLKKPLATEAYSIDDFNFNAQTLDSKVQRFATITVAASDAKSGAADFICTGTADNVVLAQAVAALPSAGGKILLSEGTFSFSNELTINKANVTIEGAGRSTVISGSINTLFRIASPNAELKALVINSSFIPSDNSGNGIIYFDMASEGYANGFIAEDISFFYKNGADQSKVRAIINTSLLIGEPYLYKHLQIRSCYFEDTAETLHIAYITQNSGGGGIDGLIIGCTADRQLYAEADGLSYISKFGNIGI